MLFPKKFLTGENLLEGCFRLLSPARIFIEEA